ncbi:MAG: helix-turn-helix transcriptional regulator [Verrucomicrobia bacterium]|nr:helix-turn-helix transcriptional regulator [Verrucomicrobiota bacterium]
MTGILLKTPFHASQFLPEANETGLLGCHPFWTRILDPVNRVKVLSEMCSGPTWRENPFYRELLRADRVRDHINVEFGASSADFTSVGVIRSRPGFTDAEQKCMRELQPHFHRAFANARVMDELDARRESHGDLHSAHHTGLRVKEVEAMAVYLLRNLFEENTESWIPSLCQWVRRETDKLNRGAFCLDPKGWRVEIGRTCLSFHLFRDYRRMGYVLGHRIHHAQGPRESTLLTPREQEVMAWVVRGKRNLEIAAILGMGPETVKTHLKHSFRKLGVENRTAAIRAMTHTGLPSS